MSKKVWYYGVINLVGIHGPFALHKFPLTYGIDHHWWDKTQNWGGIPRKGQHTFGRDVTEYYSKNKKEVEIWLLGARALALRIKQTLGS